jgi:hypothetical protein
MTAPKKQTGTESGRAWRIWIFWIFAGVALLLLALEHRAHVLGVVLLYLVVRADSGGDGPR